MDAGNPTSGARYGMVVDLDKCNGCGACAVACAVENNVPPAAERANERNGITWMRVHRIEGPGETRAAFVPMMCQQCGEKPPCASVCPQNAVEVDPASGIVAQVPVRCLGCRYCMAACPYHARFFNWWDPEWPGRLTETLNPEVSTRTRGVVEKCTFCSHRLQAAQDAQATSGGGTRPPEYTPACVEACPAGAIVFGNLDDPESEVARLAKAPGSFRLLERLETGAKVYYHTERDWVRRQADGPTAAGDCLTLYLTVLAIEYLPLVLRNRQLKKRPSMLVFEFELHKVMAVFALVGTFLSFFHQGSLGGLYGVLQGRPFAYRESLAAWPSTFFLFILSAAAVGPSFVLATTWVVSTVSGRGLVKPEVFDLLARVSGSLLLVYVLAKSVDTLVWINRTSFQLGVHPASFYAFAPFGTWALFTEIVFLGLVPALLLALPRTRRDPRLVVSAAFLACAGVATNRFVMTVQTLALPTLAFDPFLSYTPSWQEVASFLAVVAYGVILYSLSFRYLNLFPHERELAALPEA